MFPLISRAGGVLTRSGHTEAGTDFARLAGLPEAGILAEIVNEDGSVKRLPQLLAFAAEHRLKIVSIEDLIEYRIRTETFIERLGHWSIPVRGVSAEVYAYRTPFEPMQHLVAVFGDIGDGRAIPCRIHREQPVEDFLQRAPGDGDWLAFAQKVFAERRRGVLILLRNPVAIETADGDDQSTATGERHATARARMERWRDIGVGAQILRHLGISSIELLASREQRYVGLGGFGIEIAATTLVDD
jgi:3,4-dihydroxy 2-butanone 4-phosphate synthase/GTP cyclohydrolase II